MGGIDPFGPPRSSPWVSKRMLLHACPTLWALKRFVGSRWSGTVCEAASRGDGEERSSELCCDEGGC